MIWACRCTVPLTVTLATPEMPSSFWVRVFSTKSDSSVTSLPLYDTAATCAGSMEGLIFST